MADQQVITIDYEARPGDDEVGAVAVSTYPGMPFLILAIQISGEDGHGNGYILLRPNEARAAAIALNAIADLQEGE